MAVPRVMLSSTCYDLRQIRESLEDFIKSLGYETIRSEKADIGYNITDSLQSDCYVAATQCDILVGIIGGVFGNPSQENNKDSISMQEMETALENKKQIYIFIDKKVATECNTYTTIKQTSGEQTANSLKYTYVNDIRIFDFINAMKHHQSERVIVFEFETAADIAEVLKKQWATLFQNYLSQKERNAQSEAYSKINDSALKIEKSISKMDNFLIDLSDKTTSFFKFQDVARNYANPILMYFNRQVLETDGFVYFRNVDEMISIMNLLGYTSSDSDDYLFDYAFEKELTNVKHTVVILSEIFDKEKKVIFPNLDVEACEKYFQVIDEDISDPELPF